MSGAVLQFHMCLHGMYRDNFYEQNTVCNKCIWLYDICYCGFSMIQGTVAGMILKQTNGPAMLHQQRLAELVLVLQFWMVFCMLLVGKMESSALIMLKGWQPECSPYCITFCSRITEIGPIYTVFWLWM